jgi:glycosyltransferase involved in cell wall biosynthesis
MTVIFQNPEQRDQFVRSGWVLPDQAVLIRGAGVDLATFRPHDAPRDRVPLVVFASRMIESKGVREFVAAAAAVRRRGTPGRFALVGEPDPDNPESLSEATLRGFAADGVVEYWGRRTDMAETLREADLLCLPTYYPEGVPKVLIEGAASGLPLIATNRPGCREIVHNERNGLLGPERDVGSLAAAMDRLLRDQPERERMGVESRKIAESEFGLDSVIGATMSIYRALLEPSSARRVSTRS